MSNIDKVDRGVFVETEVEAVMKWKAEPTSVSPLGPFDILASFSGTRRQSRGGWSICASTSKAGKPWQRS
jgi:hypothetical protein